MAVTVPGTGASTISLPVSAGWDAFVAQQIANAIAAVSTGGGTLAVTSSGGGGPAPAPAGAATNELVLTGTGGNIAIPTGYSYVVNNTGTAPETITGANLALWSGTTGGSFFISGNATIAADAAIARAARCAKQDTRLVRLTIWARRPVASDRRCPA